MDKQIRVSSVPHGGIFKTDDGSICMRLMRKGSALKQDRPLLCADIGNGKMREVGAFEWVDLICRSGFNILQQGDSANENKENLCLCPLHFGDCEHCTDGKCDSPLI